MCASGRWLDFTHIRPRPGRQLIGHRILLREDQGGTELITPAPRKTVFALPVLAGLVGRADSQAAAPAGAGGQLPYQMPRGVIP
jgi:hypothetical protein